MQASFERAVKKRIKQIGQITPGGPTPEFFNGQISELPMQLEAVDLVVTNPPYISSIRYLETMKIEMGWLNFVESQKHYLEMDRAVIGTERFYKADLAEIRPTGLQELDSQIDRLQSEHPKMSKSVHDYFHNMRRVFENLELRLRPGGHMVIKISESRVRTELIPTHQYFIDMCEAGKFKLIADIVDDYDNNSRSLLTARNSYSGIMTQDHILVFERN